MPATSRQQVVATFEAVYQGTVALVYRHLRRLGVQEADLEDATQEVFVVVHRRLAEFDPARASINTWVCTIAHGVASNAKRKRARRLEREAQPQWTPKVVTPEAAFAQRSAARLVEQFLQRLPTERRLVFELVEIEGLSAPEAAAILKTKPNTIYSRLRHARIAFKKWVADHEASDE